MLGVGPDAHVASVFPEQAAVHEQERAWWASTGRRSRRRCESR